MRVRYTPRAFTDREAIFEYLDQRDPKAARKTKAFIAEKIMNLSYSLAPSAFRVRISASMPSGSGATRTSCTIVFPARSFRSSTSDMVPAAPGPAEAIENAKFSPARRWLIAP